MAKERGWVAKTSEPDKSGTPPEAIRFPGIFVGPPTSVSLARRFGALLVDWLLCLLVSGFFVRDRLHFGVVPSIVLVLEYAFFIGLFAQTPGMFITRIRCVSVTTGGRIGVPRAFLRGVLLAVLLPALLGWHDRLAGSVMEPVAPKG